MDINKFMKKMVRHLGLASLGLEEYYPLIKETLIEDTLSTFSQFFPYEYTLSKNLSTLDKEEGEDLSYIYYIKDEFLENNNLEIISVMAVQGMSSFQQWNAPLQTFNVDAMILEGAASGIRSQLNISTKSFKFLPPNRLKLRGYSGTEEIKIVVKIPYPNFGYVPESLSIALEQLAKLDIKCVLYPELKMYDKLDTADGSIDLKIDDWANAEEQRQELLDSWRNKAFPNSVINNTIMGRPYIYE